MSNTLIAASLPVTMALLPLLLSLLVRDAGATHSSSSSSNTATSRQTSQLRSPYFDDEGNWRAYRRFPNTDVPYNSLKPSEGNNNNAHDGDYDDAAVQCGKTTGCVAYNSQGDLKSCAGCDFNPDCCIYPQGQPFADADGVDLFVHNGRAPPAEWVDGIEQGWRLYAQPEPASIQQYCYMPEVGNGYLASVVGFASMHIGGIFNGACGGTHKARLPSPIAGLTVRHPKPNFVQGALDTMSGLYQRRYNYVDAGFVIEQTIYAHRTRRHVIVSEFELISSNITTIDISLATLFDAQG